MPKVTIEFQLPEERNEYKQAMNSKDFYFACLGFKEYLREQIHHHSEEMSDLEFATFEKIRDKFDKIVTEETDLNNWEEFIT
jgi:predicted DNA-binding protein